jgi:hypothetical protein
VAYAIGGRDAVKYGALIDGVSMSFAGVGTPYGKVGPIRPIEEPFVPNNSRGYEVIYDKEGDYFRIRDMRLPGRRVFVDFGGQVPNNKVENGRVSGRTQDEYNQVTHFKNIDKSK